MCTPEGSNTDTDVNGLLLADGGERGDVLVAFATLPLLSKRNCAKKPITVAPPKQRRPGDKTINLRPDFVGLHAFQFLETTKPASPMCLPRQGMCGVLVVKIRAGCLASTHEAFWDNVASVHGVLTVVHGAGCFVQDRRPSACQHASGTGEARCVRLWMTWCSKLRPREG